MILMHREGCQCSSMGKFLLAARKRAVASAGQGTLRPFDGEVLPCVALCDAKFRTSIALSAFGKAKSLIARGQIP